MSCDGACGEIVLTQAAVRADQVDDSSSSLQRAHALPAGGISHPLQIRNPVGPPFDEVSSPQSFSPRRLVLKI